MKSTIFSLCAVALSASALALPHSETVMFGHSWDLLEATPMDLLENVEAFDQTGLDGVAICLKGTFPDGSQLDCTKMRGHPAWTDDTFARFDATMRELVKHRSMKQSMPMAWWGHGPRLAWDDDAKWAEFAKSMATMARWTRKWGLPGIVIDPEDYGRTCQFQRFKDDKTDWAELNRLARLRGRQMSEAVFRNFPECKLLTFWTFSQVEPCYFQDPERIVRAYEDLRPAFFNGMMDGLSEKGVIYDGDEFSYTIRADRDDFYRHAWLIKEAPRCLVAEENRGKFDRQWLKSFGIYPDMHTNPQDGSWHFKRGKGEVAPNALLAMNLDQAANVADGIVWVYCEHHSWIKWKGDRFKQYNEWGTWEEAIPGFMAAIRYAKAPQRAFDEDLAAGRLKACAGVASLTDGKGEGGVFKTVVVPDAAPGEIYGVRFALKGGRRPRAWVFFHVDGKVQRNIWPVDIGVEAEPDANGFFHGAAVVRMPPAKPFAYGPCSAFEVRLLADHDGADALPEVAEFAVYPILKSHQVDK